MAWKSYKDESRVDWGTGNIMTIEQINTGALLRIADAVEKMAQNYDGLIRDRDYYKRESRERGLTIDRLKKSNAALRGHLKRRKS